MFLVPKYLNFFAAVACHHKILSSPVLGIRGTPSLPNGQPSGPPEGQPQKEWPRIGGQVPPEGHPQEGRSRPGGGGRNRLQSGGEGPRHRQDVRPGGAAGGNPRQEASAGVHSQVQAVRKRHLRSEIRGLQRHI